MRSRAACRAGALWSTALLCGSIASTQSSAQEGVDGARAENVHLQRVAVSTASGGRTLGCKSGAAARCSISAFLRGGYYQVRAAWSGEIPARVRYTVTDASAVAAFERDGAARRGQWQSLGVFRFEEGVQARVDIENLNSSGIVSVAVRFVYFGDEPSALTIDGQALPVFVAGEPVSFLLSSSGGRKPLRWFSYGSLPAGLEMERSGLLRGVPMEEGSFRIEVQVEDSSGRTASRALRIEVVAEYESSGTSSSLAELESDVNLTGDDLSEFIGIIDVMEEGGWRRVNENLFSEVWTPVDRRPLIGLSNPTPAKIVIAWSSFAWDSRRWDLVLYGGGHANYSGNDVYRWRARTRRWERASLPSDIVQYSTSLWFAVDGVDAAPASSHTYDNSVYLEAADRFLTYGGAAYNNGGAFVRPLTPTTKRPTGPYLFDLSKANGDKVGGTTGSHVQRIAPFPETLGGRMWENRDIYGRIPVSPMLPKSFVTGATGYQREGGVDVVYVSAVSGGTAHALYKHTIPDRSDPSKDTWEQVGRYWEAFAGQGSGAYDPDHNVFVRTANATFTYWDLNTASPTNSNVIFTPEDLSGSFVLDSQFGMDFDPVRKAFMLWRGDARVWKLVPPVPVARTGWTIEELPPATSETPNGNTGTGILGKWKYVTNLDVFIGLQDAAAGNIWIYKPPGWRRPALIPIIFLNAPLDGAASPSGGIVKLEAEASDPDGAVTLVEFYSGAIKLGQDSTSPYSFEWKNVPVGTHALTAVALDDAGKTAVSPVVRMSVPAGNQSPLVVLTAPTSGQNFPPGTSIHLAANASDADGSVTRVEFYEGAVKLGEDETSPYSFMWTNVSAGKYALTANAIDDEGNTATSVSVNIEVSPRLGRHRRIFGRYPNVWRRPRP